MKLRDFLKGRYNNPALGSQATFSSAVSVNGTESAVRKGFMPEDQKSDFATAATKLISSDEFIDQLSDRVKEPLDGESEDAYVARASFQMRQLLRKKLNVD